MRISSACMFSLFMVACQGPSSPEATKGPKAASADESPKSDTWQRMKDCAAQAERIVRRNKWVQGQLANGKYLSGEVTFIEWQSHYAPKYERCYLRATFFTSEAPD